MKLIAPAMLLAAALPAFAQDEDAAKLKRELDRLRADVEVYQRQLDVQAAQIREVEARLAKEIEKRNAAVQELQLARQELERAQKNLAAIEEEHVKALRLLKKAQDEGAKAKPREPDAAPRKRIEGKVTAVSAEIGLVVLSVGADDGVVEGEEFTLFRDGAFVAKAKVSRVDRKWSAATITLKRGDPRVADDASNAVFAAPPEAKPLPKGSEDALKELRRELDDLRRQVRALSDELLSSWTAQGFAADPLAEELKGHFGLRDGLVVRRVREGSAAERAGLKPFDVVPDLSERGLAEAVEKGAAIRVIRGGREVTLGK